MKANRQDGSNGGQEFEHGEKILKKQICIESIIMCSRWFWKGQDPASSEISNSFREVWVIADWPCTRLLTKIFDNQLISCCQNSTSVVLLQGETVLPSRWERFVCQPSTSGIPINVLYRNPFSTKLLGSKSTTSKRETTVSDPEMFSVVDIWQVRILSMIVNTVHCHCCGGFCALCWCVLDVFYLYLTMTMSRIRAPGNFSGKFHSLKFY